MNREPAPASRPVSQRSRMRLWIALLAFVAGAVGVAAPTAAAEPPNTAPAKPEPAKIVAIQFEFALYFTPKPATDPKAELDRLLHHCDYRCRPDNVDAPAQPGTVLALRSEWVPISRYAPPTAKSLRYLGVGVGPAEAPKLAAADRVFVVYFTTSSDCALVGNRLACQFMADLVKVTGGWIWDDESRQLFSPERWQSDRLDSCQADRLDPGSDPLPDLTKHVVMHEYADPDLFRLITLGMRKFGLPDLVVAEVPSQRTRAVGIFMNAFMQRLAEGQQPEAAKLLLTLADIRHDAVRSRSLHNCLDGAKGAVLVSVHLAKPEAGDPKNTLWRLDFPGSSLPGTAERAVWGMGELFGGGSIVSRVASGDPEMADARTRAREKFFAQEARFRTGLAFNEHLMVKGRFSQGDQTEFMWVEVVKWGPTHIEGPLDSHPTYVKTLHAGSRVTVAFDDIFDYLLSKPDGTEEGNETGKILEAREKQR